MILLQTDTNLKSIGQLICVVLLFFFVLFLSYFVARVVGGFQSNTLNKKSNIKVIEVFRIANNKVIEIVRVGNRYLVLGVCKDTITVLSELDESEIKEQEVTLKPIDFKEILEKMKNEK